ILVVEDSEDNLFLVEAYLSDPRFQLDVARNGREAVEKVSSGYYDLVLMDIEMPEMDGHTAARMIRLLEEKGKRAPVPILALPAHALKEAMEKSARAGCSGHLTKPISKATLLDAVTRYARFTG